METRTGIKGKAIVQVWLPIEDVVWIDEQRVKGLVSSRAALFHKLVEQARVVE